MGSPKPPAELREYLRSVVATAGRHLDPGLVGVYAIGSVALGDWRPGTSDVDVAIVARGYDAAALRRLAADLDHARLPVPARKLECVVYDEATVRLGDATFALNLNTGAGERTTVELDPSRVPRFWFVLDLAIAHRRAVALHGPPAEHTLGAPGEPEVRAALAQGLDWHAGDDAGAAVLAACRAWQHLCTGGWSSKSDAARWAVGRLRADEASLAAAIEAAAAARTEPQGGSGVSAAAASALIGRVIALLRS